MIIVRTRSIRSVWSALLFCVGVVFLLLGVICVPAGYGVVATLFYCVITAGGVAICWRAVRMGAKLGNRGVVIREFLDTVVLERGSVRAVTVARLEHDFLPFHTVFPSIALWNGDEVPVMSLATYDFIPGSRRQVAAAADRLTAWAEPQPG